MQNSTGIVGKIERALIQVIRLGRGHYLVVAHGGILNATLRCIVEVHNQPRLVSQDKVEWQDSPSCTWKMMMDRMIDLLGIQDTRTTLVNQISIFG